MITMTHPLTGASAEVTERAFERVWKPKGWVDASAAPADLADLPVEQVLEQVGDDPARASAVLQAETGPGGRKRKTLVEPLEQIASTNTEGAPGAEGA
jgi:hypothetical protein